MIMSSEKVMDLGVKAVDNWYQEIKFFDFQETNKDMTASINACNLFYFINI